MVVGFGFYATMQAERASLDRQKILIANGLQDQVAAVEREQESISVWDDAVTKAGNEQWMVENISVWMYSYYGHNLVYVLDAANRPIHAMREGQVVAPVSYDEDEPELRPTIVKLRQLISQAADSDKAGGTVKLVAEDLVSLGGRPAILSNMPLVPSSDRVTQAPGSEYLHISVEFINDVAIGKIAEKYLLAGAHLVPLSQPIGSAAVPLVDSRGVILGYIGWDQERPGLTLVRKVAPALIIGLLLAASVLAFLLRRLRRASLALQTSQDQAQYLAFHDTLTGLPTGPCSRTGFGGPCSRPVMIWDGWRCSTSISTGSSISTIRSAIRRATNSCARPRPGFSTRFVKSTPWRGWAATNSP